MKAGKTLVFGASLKLNRYSYYAIERYVARQLPVVAFGPRKGVVHGVNIETELIDFQDIDTVTLYMRSQRQIEYYDYIISLSPRRVIFNPGAENVEFERLLETNGILADRACTLVLLSTNQY